MTAPPRLASLDGVRGVAAVVVVLHHGLLTFPALADAYFRGDVPPFTPSPSWLLTYTPLHLVWAGTEAVYLFFVLSGIVLVLPVLAQGRAFSWLAYLPRRLVRLYLPVAAAVAFGGLLALLIPRLSGAAFGPWLSSHTAYSSVSDVARDLVLVLGPQGAVVTPLWSLQWEVLFSLLLALFVLWAVLGRRWWWGKLAVLFVVMALAHPAGVEVLFFLSMFGIGALLIVEWDRIGRTLARLGVVGWIGWLVVAVLLTTVRWWLGAVGLGGGAVAATQSIAVMGVTMLILAGAFWRPAVGLLTTRPVAWLGRISFSLYLVHEPIIVSTRFLLPSVPTAVCLLISVPLAFGAAALFSVLIEQPAHRLSKRVGRRALDAFRHDVPDAPPPAAPATT